ncbi:MAG: hypothetical protein V1813_00425 [Candidatus Aenigmatarchaeota archaeon]
MSDIPEEYRNDVKLLCRWYNAQNKDMGVSINPESISMDTNLGEIGVKHIDILKMEAMLEKTYPAIAGIMDVHGIETVGDVINYIKRQAVTSS